MLQTRTNVTATVKWYNPGKGFGFVEFADGSPDAFLHARVVAKAGHEVLPDGTEILCDLAQGQKGPQVAVIHQVLSMGSGESAAADDSTIDGTVKFYNADKGFGFITPDSGGKDIFLGARTLEKSGMRMLDADQRVRVSIRMGQKGPMAESVELI